MITKDNYYDLIVSGHSIEFRRLSLAPMSRLGKIVYQVHSDDYRKQVSELFKQADDAVNRFCELKRTLYNKV